jgi:Flp pilus assembly protein TadD
VSRAGREQRELYRKSRPLGLEVVSARQTTQKGSTRPGLLITLSLSASLLVALALFMGQHGRRSADPLKVKQLDEKIKSILFGPGRESAVDSAQLTPERRDQLESAKALIDQALMLDTGAKAADLHNEMGIVHYQLRRFAEAEADFKQAMTSDKKWSEPHNNLGDVYDLTGRWEAALAEYRKAIELAPRETDAYENLCSVLTQHGRSKEALPYAQTAIRLDPRDTEAQHCLGITLDNLGDLDGAEQAFRRAIEGQPAAALSHRSLAIVLMKETGHLDEALVEVRKATTLRPDNAKNWSLLADVLGRTSLRLEAYAAARNANELDAHDEHTQHLIKALGSPDFLGADAARRYESNRETLLQRALSASAGTLAREPRD